MPSEKLEPWMAAYLRDGTLDSVPEEFLLLDPDDPLVGTTLYEQVATAIESTLSQQGEAEPVHRLFFSDSVGGVVSEMCYCTGPNRDGRPYWSLTEADDIPENLFPIQQIGWLVFDGEIRPPTREEDPEECYDEWWDGTFRVATGAEVASFFGLVAPPSAPVIEERETIGFTGTRRGMTIAQTARLREELAAAREFHHGDCVGADEEAWEIASDLCRTIGHPPNIDTLRAFTDNDEEREPLPYMQRNQCIVDESQRLIACPAHSTEGKRGGTWSTIRKARKARKPVTIIYPDGTVATGASQ